MKSLLIFAILAIVSCVNYEDRLIEVFTCLVKNKNIKDTVVNVVKAVKAKDIPTVISTVASSYSTVKDDIKKCLQFEPILKAGCGSKYLQCVQNCGFDPFGACKHDCYVAFCL